LVCLCDTRGGSVPAGIGTGVDAARAVLGTTPVAIHCHNDCELAVANSIEAIDHGCVQIQGTINGFGERCGNANLVSVIPVLQLKRGYDCLSAAQLRKLAEVSHFVYELANLEPNKRQPFVGQSAFAHKGGLHVAAVQKNPETYEHIDPAVIGNTQRVLVSDLSGRSNLLYKAAEFGLDLESNGPVHALDQALRKALGKFYPEVEQVRLHDYKVRVLGSAEGTAAAVRVLIESGDEHDHWGTVGVSHNVIEASWQALADSMDYKL